MAPLQRLSCPALLVLVSALVAGTDESGHCPDRQRDAGVLLLPEADVFLGAFVQAHAPARDALLGCAGPLAPGVELLEVFKWAVALLNRDQGFVPGVKIGMRVYDSCGHKTKAYLQLDSLLPVLRGNSETCLGTANSSRVLGTLMTKTLRDEDLIASLLREHDVPSIPLESSAIAAPEILAKVLLESAFDMKWEHFAILHSQDEYSVSVVKTISQRVVSTASPCITRIEAIPTSDKRDASELHRLRSLLSELDDSVIVVASPTTVEALAEVLSSEPSAKRRQWLFSWVPSEEALERLGVLLNMSGFYALGPYPPSVRSFEEHWSKLAEVSVPGKPEDQWYLDLVAANKHCRVQGLRTPGQENASPCADLGLRLMPTDALVRTSRALPAMRGVFTLAQALRSAWKATCRGQAGLCPELRAMTRRQFAQAFLEPKGSGAEDAPVSGRGARAAADVLGELGNSHLALTRFLHTPGQGADFTQVILYDSEEAKLLEKDTKFLPTLCSPSTCQNCIRFRSSRLDETESHPSSTSTISTEIMEDVADVVLPILLPLHTKGQTPFTCGRAVNRNAVQDLEAASWMVGKINSNGNLLPGLKLGLRVIDTCSSSLILTREVSSVLEAFTEQNLPTVFMSSGSPEHSQVAASILARLNVTLISTGDVAETRGVQSFRYQIPLPVEKVADATVHYLQHLNWNFVSVVASESEARAVQAFKKHAHSADICTAVDATATGDLDALLVRLKAASATGARAVVLWTNPDDTIKFLDAVRRARAHGLLRASDLVLLHGSGQPVSFDGFEEEVLGAVLLRPQYGQVRDFESYYERLKADQDRFFAELWEQGKVCRGPDDCMVEYTPSRSVVDVMQAVVTAATALRNLRDVMCGAPHEDDAGYCTRLLKSATGVGVALDAHVRRAKTARIGYKDLMFGFTEDGHGDIGVDLWNVRKSSAGIAPQMAGHFVDQQYAELVPLVSYGSTGREVPLSDIQSECIATPCKARCARKPVDFLLVPSPDDLYLAASFSVHEPLKGSPFSCSPTVSEEGLRNVEAFLWALDQINTSPSVLQGVTVGAVVFDTCGSREKTYRDVSNFVSESLTSLRSDVNLPQLSSVFGFVAGGHKCTVKPAADILSSVGVPTVASDSSLTVLSSDRYPTLLRVLPSNGEVAEALLKLLRHFKWSYVSVVYDDDDEDVDVFEQLKAGLEAQEVRLGAAVKLTRNGDPWDLPKAMGRLRGKQREGSRVVVLLLRDKEAEVFFKHARETGTPLHNFTFVAVGLRSVLSKFPEATGGSLSLQVASSDVPGFKDYLQHLNYRGNDRDPWFRSFIEQKSGCRGPVTCSNATPMLLSPSADAASTVVTSVFALASGLDQARRIKCQGPSGCSRDITADEDFRGLVMNFTRGVRITRHDGSVFKFAGGNSGNGRLVVGLFRHRRNAAVNDEFALIGTYNRDEGLQMNASIPSDTSGRSPYDVNSTCESRTNCNSSVTYETPRDPSVQSMTRFRAEPTLTIGAMFSVHKRGPNMFTCGPLQNDGTFQNLIALAYAVDLVNRNQSQVQLDAVVFDYCGTKQRAEKQVFQYFSSPEDAKTKPLVSMLTYDSNVATELKPILRDANVPVILTTTNPKFSQETRSTALQTIPPVNWQAEALLGLLRHYDWTYVYVLYIGDQFGQDANYYVTKALNRMGICVADALRIDRDASDNDVLSTVMRLADPDVRVVMVLAQDKFDAAKVLRAARRSSLLERFVWVGTEGFSDNAALLDALEGADVDVFSLKLENEKLPGYTRFVSGLTLGKHDPIPDAWFEEFWQRKFRCRLPNSESVQEQFKDVCTGRESLRDVLQDRYVYHTVETVKRVAEALKVHMGKNCPSDTGLLDNLERCKKDRLNHEVSMALLGTDVENCLECQPSVVTTFGYQLLKVNGSSSRNYSYEQVGSYRNNLLRVSEDDVDFSSGVAPMSTCMRDCDDRCPAASPTSEQKYLRQHRESLTANFRTVWGIVVTALSLLGIVLVLICALYFLMAFPVTVGTTVLGYMILAGLLALYAVNFAFVVGATEASCGVRRFLMGLAYSIIFSGMLVKVLNTWRLMGYHGNNRMHHDGTQLTSPAGLLVVACGLVVIQVVLTAAWLVLMPPRIGLYERVWRCAPPASFEDELVVSMVYVMLLLAVTILFSVLTWPCRDNNGESRWILACCVFVSLAWLAWTVLSTQLPLQHRDATIAVANLVCATLVMLCLYLRKVYLYNKLARQARDQEIKARLQPRGPYTPSVYGTLHKNGAPVAPVFYGSQASLTTSKKLNGQFSRLSMDDLASDGSGSVQVQGADLYPLEMYDGGSQFQPPSSLYGSTMMLDDNVVYAR